MHDAARVTLNEENRGVAQAGPTVSSGSGAVRSLEASRFLVDRAGRARAGGGGREDKFCSPAFHWYAVFVAVSILALICSGGLVTSHDAGLAVPDWPTSFGYNMFALPFSRWLAPGGVRLEHSHRLIATLEGCLTAGLAVWAFRTESRRWVRFLSCAAFGAVVFQGLLGGLRVILVADWIGIVHGCFAQAFFALTALVALVTSRWWQRLGAPDDRRPSSDVVAGLSRKILVTALLIYLQLALGASMRHAHAGLSIPDFPRAYGHWWPQVTRANLPQINQERETVLHQPATSLGQIHLQMAHRFNAVLVLGGVVAVALGARRRRGNLPRAWRLLAGAGTLLVGVQVTLGMYVIWTNKAADVATAHVATGATLLVWGVLTYASLRRWVAAPVHQLVRSSVPSALAEAAR